MQNFKILLSLHLLASLISQFLSIEVEISQNMDEYKVFKISGDAPLIFITKNADLLDKRSLIISQKSTEKLTYALGYGNAPVKGNEGAIQGAYSVRIETNPEPFILFPVIEYNKQETLYISVFIDSNEPVDVNIQLFFTNDSYISATIDLNKVCNLSYGLLESDSLYIYAKISGFNLQNDEIIIHNDSYQQAVSEFTFTISSGDSIKKTVGLHSIFELATSKSTIWTAIQVANLKINDVLILKISKPVEGFTGNIILSSFLLNSLPSNFNPAYSVQYYKLQSNRKGEYQKLNIAKDVEASNYQLFVFNLNKEIQVGLQVNDSPFSNVSMGKPGNIPFDPNIEKITLNIDNLNEESFILVRLQKNKPLKNFIRGNGDYNKFNSNEGVGKQQEFKIRFENVNSMNTFIKFFPSNGIITSLKYKYFNNTYGINIPSDDLDISLDFVSTEYIQLQFPKIEYGIIECLVSVTFTKTTDNSQLSDLSIINDPQQVDPKVNRMNGYTFTFDVANPRQNFLMKKEQGDFVSVGIYKSQYSTRFFINGVSYTELNTERTIEIVDTKTLIDLLYINVSPLPTTCNLSIGYMTSSLKQQFTEPQNKTFTYTVDNTNRKSPRVTISIVEKYLEKVKDAQVEYYVTLGYVINRNYTYYLYEELFNPKEDTVILNFKNADNIQFNIRDSLDYYVQLYATEVKSKLVFAYDSYIISSIDNDIISNSSESSNHTVLIVMLVLMGIFAILFVIGLIFYVKRRKESNTIDNNQLLRAIL